MATTKKVYSHSSVNLPDEPQHPDRNITVLDGNFGRVIARVHQTDKDNALENAQMIVNALNLAPELLEALQQIKDRQFVQMLCPTAPNLDASEGFKQGAQQATMECVRIADKALAPGERRERERQ